MALISSDYIDSLNEHAGPMISEIIGAVTDLKRAGRNQVGLCVFHEEKTPSLHVDDNKGTFHCFGCHAKGGAINFVMDYYNLPFPDAVKRLAELTHFRAPEYEQDANDKSYSATHKRARLALNESAAIYKKTLLESSNARQYAHNRGITSGDVERFQIGYAPDSFDNIPKRLIPKYGVKALMEAGLVSNKEGSRKVWDFFRHRLMFPVRDMRGRVVAYGGRTLLTDPTAAKKAGKYINTRETELFSKSQHLYGLYESTLQQPPERGVFNVVEGYLDVVASHRHGFTNTAAPMGTALTENQLIRLFKSNHTVRMVFDSDSAGRLAAFNAVKTALPMIDGQHHVAVSFLPNGEDPDSLLSRPDGRDRFKAVLTKSMPASQFIIRYLSSKADPSPEGKTKLASEVRELLSLCTNDDFKDILGIELSSKLGITLSDIAPSQTPQRLYAQMSPTFKGYIDRCSPAVISYCALVLSEPSWLELCPLKSTDSQSVDDEMIESALQITNKAIELDEKPENIFSGDARYLVMYLKSITPSNIKDQIAACKAYRDHASLNAQASAPAKCHADSQPH